MGTKLFVAIGVLACALIAGVSSNQIKQGGSNRGPIQQTVYYVSATQNPAAQTFAVAGANCQYSEVFRNGIKQYSPREFILTPDGQIMFPGTVEPEDTIETVCFTSGQSRLVIPSVPVIQSTPSTPAVSPTPAFPPFIATPIKRLAQ
jgi:hypothetical protein